MKSFPIALMFILFANIFPAHAQEIQPYLMRAGDKISIKVLGHEELSSPNILPLTVRPDGKISFALVGEFDVVGKTVEQLCAEVEERYRKYLRKPFVTINLVEPGTTRVCVLGEIQRQGLYELSKSHRLIDALAAANGFVAKSSKKNIFVIRAGQEEPCLVVNFKELLTKGDREKNIELNEGDCVYVSSNHKIVFAKDILPFLNGIYYVDRVS